jgi:hypothetical protein
MKSRLIATLGLVAAACSPAPASTPAAPAATPELAAPAPEPAKPSGPPVSVEVDDDHHPEAWVTDVHLVKDADLKIYSTAGGDPAINGLYTYLTVYTQPDGWTRTYMIGDFNSWEVIEESPTRVVLKVSRSWIDEPTGDIKTAEEKRIIEVSPDPEKPITVTPAT